MKKLILISFLYIFSIEGINQSVSEENCIILEESVSQLIDVLGMWKEEVNTNLPLVELLDQMIHKLQDPLTPLNVKVLYGIFLVKIHAVEDPEEQKGMLHHILSQSSYELVQEAAVMIQLLRDEQA